MRHLSLPALVLPELQAWIVGLKNSSRTSQRTCGRCWRICQNSGVTLLRLLLIAGWLVAGHSREVAAGPLSSPQASTTRTSRYSPDEYAEVLRQAGRHLASITARTMPSVVNIESTHVGKSGETEDTGSGVIMKSPRTKGLFIITNRHVVEGARLNQIDIHLHDGRVLAPVEKLEDADSDLAVLRIAEIDVQAAQFGDSDNLDIGHFVLAMGSPFGLTESVTLGIISAKGRRSLELPGRNVVNQDFLQTDAAINPGNSGGPLIDLDGRVIGINTAIASQGGGNEGIGFSIPSNLVQFVVTQLLDFGRVRRGYLGVQLDDHFNFETARRYGLDRKQGARVTRVVEKTPAALAGIRADDVILNFDGFEVMDERDLINKVSVTPVNKQVRVIVLRAGKQQILTVVLSEKPEADMSQLSEPDPVPSQEYLVPDSIRPAHGRRLPDSPSLVLKTIPLTAPLASQTGYPQQQTGLLVKQVSIMPEQAEQDQLQLYDVIEEVARQPVSSSEELEAALKKFQRTSPVVLKIRRIVDGQQESRLILFTPGRDELTRNDF